MRELFGIDQYTSKVLVEAVDKNLYLDNKFESQKCVGIFNNFLSIFITQARLNPCDVSHVTNSA
jgi:hypothetical protein